MDPQFLLSASFKMPPIGRVPVRAHWTLLLILALDLCGAAGLILIPGLPLFASLRLSAWPWWLLPAMIPVLALSMYVHDAAHVWVGRRVGARITAIQLQMLLGGVAEADLPVRPWPLLAYGASGMLANLVVVLLCSVAVSQIDAAVPNLLLAYLGYASARQLWVNAIFPVYPGDSGLVLRALFWPLIGLKRAVSVAIVASYLSCVLVIVLWGILGQNLLMICLGLMLLFAAVREHQSIRAGFDPWLRLDPANWPSGPTLMARWQRKRKQRASERREVEEEAEQDVLDRLLAKVSEHGLPALTAAERASLERISRRQRARAEAEQQV